MGYGLITGIRYNLLNPGTKQQGWFLGIWRSQYRHFCLFGVCFRTNHFSSDHTTLEPFFFNCQPKGFSYQSWFHVSWTHTLRQVWPLCPPLEFFLQTVPQLKPRTLAASLRHVAFARKSFSQPRSCCAIGDSICLQGPAVEELILLQNVAELLWMEGCSELDVGSLGRIKRSLELQSEISCGAQFIYSGRFDSKISHHQQ